VALKINVRCGDGLASQREIPHVYSVAVVIELLRSGIVESERIRTAHGKAADFLRERRWVIGRIDPVEIVSIGTGVARMAQRGNVLEPLGFADSEAGPTWPFDVVKLLLLLKMNANWRLVPVTIQPSAVVPGWLAFLAPA